MNQILRHLDAGPQWSGMGGQTIIEVVDRAAEEEPDKPAMIFEEGLGISRAEFRDRIERFAGYLGERIQPGDKVALMLDNRAEFMVALFAIIAARGIVVSISPTAQVDDAGHIVRDSAVKLAVAGEAEAKILRGLKDCPTLSGILEVRGAEPDGLAEYSGRRPLRLADAQCRREDVANIYYTSGTTGRPKGCMLHHGWWLRVCDIHIRLLKLGPDDRSLCCLPFYYADPAFLLLCSLQTGGTLVVMRRFSVSRFWNVVRTFGVTEMLLFSTMVVLLVKAPPTDQDRNHKVRVSIAVAVPADLHRQFVERFDIPILDNYGSTEATINTRVPLSMHDEMLGSGSMGLAMPECDLRIVDDQDADVPTGAVGELLVRAPDIFVGYVGREDAYEEAMRGGWYHTGDLARADERGFYYFMGRKKDIIRRGGENIAAAEVEEVLRTHPMILEAAVIPVPDEIRGEEVKAYVLLADGAAPEKLPPEQIAAHCEQRLAKYKIPRYIAYQLGDFPRTPSMRVMKDQLRKAPDLIAGSWDREAGRSWPKGAEGASR
jgi:crotonobetaine/carnitine-CoA ligase